jgi:hypothetical protein
MPESTISCIGVASILRLAGLFVPLTLRCPASLRPGSFTAQVSLCICRDPPRGMLKPTRTSVSKPTSVRPQANVDAPKIDTAPTRQAWARKGLGKKPMRRLRLGKRIVIGHSFGILQQAQSRIWNAGKAFPRTTSIAEVRSD